MGVCLQDVVVGLMVAVAARGGTVKRHAPIRMPSVERQAAGRMAVANAESAQKKDQAP